MLETATDLLISLVYPRSCSLCGDYQPNSRFGPACEACWSVTRVFDLADPICIKCGAIFGTTKSVSNSTCWHCDDSFFDLARACGPYSNGLKAEILNLKTTPVLSREMEEILDRTIDRFGMNTANLIVPVPLSRKRQLERGFNQSEIIARKVSKKLDVNIDSISLQRTTHSQIHRIGMDRKARELSVKNAFRVSRPNLIREKTILLIDDVFTTGATVSSCAKALKKSGAKVVNVLTIANALRPI